MECDSFVRIFMTPLLKVICSIHKPVLVGWFRDVIDKDMSYQQENVPIPINIPILAISAGFILRMHL